MRRTKPAAAIACAVAPAWTGAGPADAAGGTNLSCGEVITASITLTGNLHCDGTALYVDADNDVTLDLGGHSVTGDGTGDGVVLSSSDVPDFTYTVQNGRISGFASAVRAGSTTQADVNGVTISASPTAIEFAPQLTDFSLADSRITGATEDFAYDPGEADDFLFLDVTGDTIVGGSEPEFTGLGSGYYHDNRITDSTINLQTPGNDLISDNVFDDSPVVEGTFGGYLQILDNTFENANVGLMDYSMGEDTISGNTFRSDDVGASLYMGFGGPYGGDSITGNRFVGNRASGLSVYLAGGTSVGTIASNTATGNGFQADGAQDLLGHPLADGITIDQNGGSVTLTGNRTTGNAGYGIWLDESGDVTNGGGNISHGDSEGCAPLDLCTY